MNAQQYQDSFNADLVKYQISVDYYKKIVARLPDKKFYEYAYHKFFNPTVKFITWESWDIWNYPVQDALRFEHIFLNNTQHFQNKSVVDIGCHLGYMSMIAAHLGSTNVTGTNVRLRELEISTEVCQCAGIKNVRFDQSDVNNLAELTNLCNSHQTVLFSGLIYHLSNPFAVLETIAMSSAECIIIDNIELESTKNLSEPLLVYSAEDVGSSVNGYKDNATEIIVGVPNQQWIDFVLSCMGWTKKYDKSYSMIHQGSKNRRISTWVKI
jgi:2-polyprenyl-3-methyl-5-hydroxy-6-metoxy-1,4-benzoquinol methylase